MDQPTITTLQQENEHLQQRVAELERETVIAHRLYANFPDGFVFVFDHDLRYLEANGLAVVRGGVNRDNLVGRTIWEALPADTVTQIEPSYRAALAGTEMRIHIPFADGIFEVHVLPIRDNHDKIIAGMAIAHDITERQQLEQQFQQSQTMLQLVIDNLPQAIFWKDCDLIYQGCNQTFANFVGVETPAQIVGKSDDDLPWKPEEAISYRQDDQRVMARGEPEYHIIETQQHADGKQSWVDMNKIPLCDANGEMIGILSTYEDITERQQQEDELRRYAAIIEQTTDGIFTTDAAGNVLMMNPAFRCMTGLGATDDISTYRIVDFYPNWVLERVRNEGVPAAIGNGVWNGETIIVNIASGEEVPVSQVIIAHQNTDDSLDFLSTIVRNLTERKRQEDERAALQQQIIEAQRDALCELSTPLIPLTDDVVIMPLIGTIDSGRAQMIMETLLEGVVRHQADLAILDITGVLVVDTQVAQSFILAAKAVRLLGAQVMLTGIQPQIAQTLVHLGIDLSDIQTQGSLQTGIAVALYSSDRRHRP